MRKCGLGVLMVMLFASCSINKFVPEGKRLYNGVEIEFTGDVDLKEEDRVREAIEYSLYPIPNQKLLGLVYFNLWVYFSFDESKDKWYSKFIYNRFAREPVYVDDINLNLMKNLIRKEMQDEGHFGSQVESEIKEKEKSATILYKVKPSRPTIMAKVERPQGNEEIDSLVRSFRRMSVKKDERYRLEAFEIERRDIAEYVRSRGYYDFNADDIYYLVDTAAIDSVNISMRIKRPAKDSIHRKYYIGEVNAYTTNGVFGSGRKSATNFAYRYQDLNVYQDFKYIDRKTLSSNIIIDKGDLFSIEDYNLTLSRLVNLNIFKYVNIEYEKQANDSLEVNILMTPTPYKSFLYEGEFSTSDRSFLGSSLSVSFSNNNTLRRAEKLRLALSGGAELQYFDTQLGFSILNVNASATYEVPRLIVPFKTREFRSSIAPKTFLKLEDDYQLWVQYFNVNTVKAHYGYEWKTENRFSFSLQPFFVDYLNVFRTTAEFDSLAMDRPLLALSYSDQLIMGSLFTIAHTNRLTEGQRNSYVLRWNIETSGNTATLFTNSITDVPISQYFRTDFEYRFIRKFTPIENFVFRMNIGLVEPYGNSQTSPFTKQFFMGGPTSLRGFAFRSVGPGRTVPENIGQNLNPIDQFGDLRLLFNVEYRFPLFSVFRGATFFDAGNVWLLKPEEGRTEGLFQWGEFYKELAWNTGFGLRMDVDYFAVRLDFGIPLYTPYESVGERWLYQSPEQGVFPWLRKNVVLSAGIGYPF